MEVEQARAFLAVAEELHFGRAADRLRIAQPPLSRIIKKLEQSLKAELFIRSTRSVELTAAGAALVEPAKKLVDASEAARRTVHEAVHGEIGVVKLGFAGASVHQSIGDLVRRVKKECPRITLELESSQFAHVGLQRVLDGTLDAVIGRWDFLPTEIDSLVVGVEELLVAVPSTHRLAGRSEISFRELAGEDWIVLPSGFGSALYSRMSSLSMSAGFIPNVIYTAPDSSTLMVLVGAEMGCTLTLDSVRNYVQGENVTFLPIVATNKHLDVRLIWDRSNTNPALQSVLETARRTFAAFASPDGKTGTSAASPR